MERIPVSRPFRLVRTPRRSRTRGVTLIEVMVVVTILGLLAGAVAVAVFPKYRQAQITTTHTNAIALRSYVNMWRMSHPDDGTCPTLAQLRSSETVDDASRLKDPWGTPFKIVCHENQTTVISLGPDAKESADDIVEPDPVAVAAE
jgi:general secretion pathway protein G